MAERSPGRRNATQTGPILTPASARPWLGRTRLRGVRLLRGSGWGLLAAVAALLFGYGLLLETTRLPPPDLPPEPHPPLTVRGERAYRGDSWLSRERGVWELHLAGTPYAMGWAQARLGSRLLADSDAWLLGEIERDAPMPWGRTLSRLGLRWRFRHLEDDVPPARLAELAGLADGYLDPHDGFLPTFHRMLLYHALPELAGRRVRSPLLGASAFAASGSATSNGHLLVGRNFELDGADPFDADKAVMFVKPAPVDGQARIPFASVAWIGEVGAVTGLNTERVFVSVDAARSDSESDKGLPVELLVREILERAHGIDEAVALVKKIPVMAPALFLVADGKTGEAAVLERTPSRLVVRRSRDTIAVTDHAVSPAFARDAENDRLRRYLPSETRYRRLLELLRHNRGSIDPRRALEILRDKSGVGGAPLGLGNRNAIDPLRATHSVVADVTTLTLWVSVGPHCLGRYVGFDLRKELSGQDRQDPPDLPADPLLGSPELRRYDQAVAEVALAEKLARRKPARALEHAEKAEGLVETMPEPHKLIGDLVRRRDKERARAEYQRFLALEPPYLRDIEKVRGILSSL